MPERGASTEVPRIVDVRQQMRNDEARWWGMWVTMLAFTLVVGVLAFGSAPRPFAIAVVILVMACAAAFLRPRIGVYLTVFLTLVGDFETNDWWPFTRNMSSRESIMYVSDRIFVSPLELLMLVTVSGWVLRRLVDPTWAFHRGRMFWPVMTFTVFVVFGVLNGRSGGSDSRAALLEYRPLLYIPVLYVLVTNLLTSRRQYQRLLLLALVAVSIQSVFALLYYRRLSAAEKEALESLSEHAATIHMNVIFVFLLALILLRCRTSLRWTVAVLSVPVVYAYALSQRRAAMVALVAGIAALALVLYYRRRRMFWFFVPTLAFTGTVVVLGTWNAAGPIGLPAQAVKTVLFPGQLAESERGSDLYRIIENYDLWFTIRASPLRGFGFGQRFLQPIPLPDISFFEFYQYLPHNSVLWIWIKMGFFGFVAMLVLFARSLQIGVRSAVRIRTEEQAAVVIAGFSFCLMLLVFSYVDIAWGIRSTVFLAFAFACCGDLEDAHDDVRRRVEGVHTRQLETVTR